MFSIYQELHIPSNRWLCVGNRMDIGQAEMNMSLRYCHEISRSVSNKKSSRHVAVLSDPNLVCMIMIMLELRTSVHTIYYVHNASLEY